jgi:hypothetical protein
MSEKFNGWTFLAAIPVGADLSLVTTRFLHWLLVDPVDGVVRFAEGGGKVAIEQVAGLLLRQIEGGTVKVVEWHDAADAAEAAANAAYAADAADAYAAEAAAYAAEAAAYAARAAAYATHAAAYAARAAAYATHAAAYAARDAAYAAKAAAEAAEAAAYAARAAARIRQSEKLLELLELLRRERGAESPTRKRKQ